TDLGDLGRLVVGAGDDAGVPRDELARLPTRVEAAVRSHDDVEARHPALPLRPPFSPCVPPTLAVSFGQVPSSRPRSLSPAPWPRSVAPVSRPGPGVRAASVSPPAGGGPTHGPGRPTGGPVPPPRGPTRSPR